MLEASNTSVSAASEADAYAELLNSTRNIDAARREQRERWYASLPVDNKEELLFELEILLKAAVCFANPRNHPGPPKRTSVVAQDFREAVVLVRDGLSRAIQLIRLLLGAQDRAYVFHRYLETVLPEGTRRTRLLHDGSTQTSPEDGLVALRHAMTNAIQVMEGLLRAPRVPFRIFYAALSLLQREIVHNAFFNPLSALEFRPEFDRIQTPDVLSLLRKAPGARARHFSTLALLSLFRMLRYLRLLGRITTERRDLAAARAYLVLSVLRSDARALADYIQRNAGPDLADAYGQLVLGIPARELESSTTTFRADGKRLVELRATLEGIAGTLNLEMRRSFLYDLPPLETLPTEQTLRESLELMVANVRPALRNSVLLLGRSLGGSLDERAVFDDPMVQRETNERLRRDVWMFGQILRAFSAKAQHTAIQDRWEPHPNSRYVKQFLAYFRALGHPVVTLVAYPRFDAFIATMRHLDGGDLVDAGTVQRVLNECAAFQEHLVKVFDDLCHRDDLKGIEFDRRASALTLRSYLREVLA